MRFARLALLTAMAVSSQACLVVALHPVYDPDSIAFEPALVGDWMSDEDNLTLSFERAEWHSYHLVLDDSGKVTRLSARLTRLNDDVTLMDVTPLDGTDVPPLELPVHLVFKVTLAADALTVATLNYDRFYALGKNSGAGLEVTIDGRQNAVLTGSTGDLRAWLLAHASEEGIFSVPTTLKRKPVAPSM